MKYLIPFLLLFCGCTATKLHMITREGDKIISDHTMYRCSIGQKVDCDVKTPEGWTVTYRNDGGANVTREAMAGAMEGLTKGMQIQK